MEKRLDEIWKEISDFKSLKPDEQNRELTALKEKLKAIDGELIEIDKKIGKAGDDHSDAVLRRRNVEKEYEESRQRRQNAIASGEDDRKFKISVSDLAEEKDRLEDLIIGLARRVESFTIERSLLLEEQLETGKMILQFQAIPLVLKMNVLGEQYRDWLIKLIEITDQLGEPLHRFRSGAKRVFCSNIDALEKIPRFFIGSEINDLKFRGGNNQLLNIFDMSTYRFEQQKKREEESAKKAKATEKGRE